MAGSEVPTGRRAPGARARCPVGRAIALLEAVAAAPDGLGLSELARRADVPKTSAGRALGDLLAAGMVVQDRGRYLPGSRMLALGAQICVPGSAMLRRLVSPFVVLLHDETGLDASFAVLRQGRSFFESTLYGPERATVFTALPQACPAHCTGSGKALLAFGHRYEPAAADPRRLPRYTAATITDPMALLQELLRVRQIGYAVGHSEYVDGIESLAVPVFDNRRGVIGALAVCGRSGETNPPRVLLSLRRVAGAVGTAFRTASS